MITHDWMKIRKELNNKQHCTIAFTNGVFDIIHTGHIKCINKCSEVGNIVIVGINGDFSTSFIKGKHRPVIPAEERAEIIHSVKGVTHVVIFEEPNPQKLIQMIQPQFYIKGGEEYSKENLENMILYSHRTQIIIIEKNSKSTTRIINKIRSNKIN